MSTAPKTKIEDVEAGTDSELPDGWATAFLFDLCRPTQWPTIPTKALTSDGFPVFGANGQIGFYPKYNHEKPTVLITCRGATCGTLNICKPKSYVTGNAMALDDLPEQLCDLRFLYYTLKNRGLEDTISGSAQPQITRQSLQLVDLPFAPLNEQRRIVKSIQAADAEIVKTKRRLRKTEGILKHFRQTVLAAACSGKLTEDWRAKNAPQAAHDEVNQLLSERKPLQHKTPIEPDGTPLEGPEGWASANLDQLTVHVTSGSRGWAKFYAPSGPLFIRAENLNSDTLRLNDVAHVQPPRGAEGSRTRVRRGDLLITITGANVTKSGWVDSDMPEAYVSQHVALVRPVNITMAPYLDLWLHSPSHGREKLLSDAYGAGKPGLNLDNIREMIVAVPSASEQQEIVRRVDTLFQLADAIEKRVAAATARAEKLTQAILAKAFRGELVPTEAELARREEREYEPASVLLERIKKEREAEGAKGKKRGKKREKTTKE